MNLNELLARKEQSRKPAVVCLCGSTRFHEIFAEQNLRHTLAGYMVLSIGANAKDADLRITEEMKIELDILHLHKIDLADIVYVINADGYVGESTRREIEYAYRQGKTVRWHCMKGILFPEDFIAASAQ